MISQRAASGHLAVTGRSDRPRFVGQTLGHERRFPMFAIILAADPVTEIAADSGKRVVVAVIVGAVTTLA